MMHNIFWFTFPYSRVEVSCLTVSGKKKKEVRRFLENLLHEWWNTPDLSLFMTVTKAIIRQAHICILLPDIDKLCPPLLVSFSLSNYWTLGRWTKASHNSQRLYSQKKKKKKFSSKNYLRIYMNLKNALTLLIQGHDIDSNNIINNDEENLI